MYIYIYTYTNTHTYIYIYIHTHCIYTIPFVETRASHVTTMVRMVVTTAACIEQRRFCAFVCVLGEGGRWYHYKQALPRRAHLDNPMITVILNGD